MLYCQRSLARSYEHKMDMRNTPIYCSTDLLPSNLTLKAVERSNWILNDEVI